MYTWLTKCVVFEMERKNEFVNLNRFESMITTNERHSNNKDLKMVIPPRLNKPRDVA